VSFDVPAQAYDHFMGRYSRMLAPLFADFSGVAAEGTVLDVGCGPGALTGELIDRLGVESVAAVDPSRPFVDANRQRHPDLDIEIASVESLTFESGRFDRALAQLVVHHLADPVAGVAEMSRVTRHGGTVAACVWDHVGGVSPLGPFWAAVREFDPSAPGESSFPGSREGHLVEIFELAGLDDVHGEAIELTVHLDGFDDWWAPYPLGVGPAGRYVADLAPERRRRLEELCRRQLPEGPFDLPLRVWAARGLAGPHTM
jgi:SAM-dependent methyltransferase